MPKVWRDAKTQEIGLFATPSYFDMANILVIDDDPWVLKFFVQILTDAGHTVYQAENGHTGLELYREKLPDLLITDMIMPDKDGLSTIMDLDREFPDARIIAISGGGVIESERYLALAKTIGALVTLEKPVDRKDFLAAVDKALTLPQPQ